MIFAEQIWNAQRNANPLDRVKCIIPVEEKTMNVGLYIFDAKKNELRLEVVYMDEIRLLCNKKSENSTIYVTTIDANKRTSRYTVSCTEGKVIYDHLWLYQRDDEKAKALFKEYYEKKKKELDNKAVAMWRRADLLERIPVIANGV